MSRPQSCRRVEGEPAVAIFKPAGVPTSELEEIQLTLDEFEALRLADGEGMQQADAAVCMEISRPTFGRTLKRAHGKVADALLHGKALIIEGGPVHLQGKRCGRRRCQEAHEGAAPLPGTPRAS